MSMLKQKIREQLRVRPFVLGLCVFALGSLLIIPVFAAGEDAPTATHWMALDDIHNRVNRPPDSFGSAPTPSPGNDTNTGDAPNQSESSGNQGQGSESSGNQGQGSESSGNQGQGSDSSGNQGQGSSSNNGHGNNQDGVDSSNPGQGGGGPNGANDPSCSGSTCIDDESGTGGRGQGQGGGRGQGRGNRGGN